jgi:hypothetical protein
LTRGSCFHACAAEYLKALVRADVECDLRLTDGILERGLRRFRVTPTQEHELRKHWSRWVRGYLREHEVVGVEMGLAVDWRGDFAPFVAELDHDTGDKKKAAAEGWLWRAALDLVDLGSECEPGGVRVIDWKTGMYIPSESELRDMFQPRQYCGAYALANDLDRDSMIEFVWYSVPWGVRVVVEYQVAHVVADFLRWLDVFRGRDRLPPMDPYWTTPRRTDGCGVCPARKGCAAWEGEEIGPLLPRIVRLEAELKAARAEMRAHVKTHGELVEFGHRAHPKPKERNNSDALALLARVEQLGIPPNPEWFSVNLTSIQSKKKGADPITLKGLWADGFLSRKAAGSAIVIDVAESELVPELVEDV